ncbi:peptide-methionine (R)-S-oxide reductase [Jannaschia sp. S6380]|uniref:peptide-methionine (R)-S-oxide reductase n=1 Tax=Jannaschia sp. S6380 TaxID=2926408 RepID=UPI001FF59672|nr:peptide-methionine (R)-S-oxide reductase [Jannaschia sp. S6380]MCK0165925.1 peptide-methionine (R)-S-oxide reductase [Jannaschia sp. S6380]
MTPTDFTRRGLLTSAATLAAGTALAGSARAETVVAPSGRTITKYVPEESDFPYEVQRTEAEWMDHLDGNEEAYGILRKANTEWPKTTEMWREAHPGGYLCRGCDLPVYDAGWFEPLDKGWVFFHHAEPNSVMFGLDGAVRAYGQAGMTGENFAMSEVHCRRCGSHLGHHIKVAGMWLHCINGTSLTLA